MGIMISNGICNELLLQFVGVVFIFGIAKGLDAPFLIALNLKS